MDNVTDDLRSLVFKGLVISESKAEKKSVIDFEANVLLNQIIHQGCFNRQIKEYR